MPARRCSKYYIVLASDEAKAITGQIIVTDFGATL